MELIYKIIHIPSGNFVTNYIPSDHSYYKNEAYPFRPSWSKKGRGWKRMSDVLVAYRTLRKRFEEKGYSDLIEDYQLQVYELQLSETIPTDKINESLAEKDKLYKQRKLQEAIRSKEYQIEYAQKNIQRLGSDLPNLKKELEKLKSQK